MTYTHREIAPDTFEIKDLGFVSLYLLVSGHHAVLIDTGFGVGDLAGYVAGLIPSGSELQVINTHIHPDHSNGNRQFARTAIGRREWQNHGLRWNSNLPNIASGQWNPAASFAQPYLAAQMPEGFDPDAYNRMVALGIPEPDRLLDDGDEIRFGARRLRAIGAASHTTGSLCFWEPETGFLFAGDALCQGADWLLNLKSRASFEEIFETFARLGGLSGEVRSVYPAHGRKNLPASLLAEIAEKMALVQSGKLRGVAQEHRFGAAVFYDFGDYGPLMAPGFSAA